MFDSTFPQEDDELRASSEYVSMRRKIFDLIDTSTDTGVSEAQSA
jgi:hypothetical protein